MGPQAAALLRTLPLYARLAPEGQRLLAERGRLLTLRPRERAFREGEPCRRALLVLSGSLKVQKVSPGGHEIVLYHVGPGGVCHLTTACLLGGRRYPAEAVAETAVRAWALPAAAFDALHRQDTAFRAYVAGAMEHGMEHLVALVEAVAFGALDARLAATLLAHAGPAGEVPMTHQELAAELGTAREVVSRLLKELERHGWLRLGRGRVQILDAGPLRRLARRGPEEPGGPQRW